MHSDRATLLNLASRIESAIERIGLNLSGQRVLTEAASGAFATTSVMAAVAGAAHVAAAVRESRWGTVDEIRHATFELAEYFGVRDVIDVTTQATSELAHEVDVVTNLGFVRPISRQLIECLPAHAAIALMWEPWEIRAEDIDLAACRDHQIPVIATNEHHPEIATFRFVGLLALKLLFEKKCEVDRLKVLIIGSDPFGRACEDVLSSLGAQVIRLDPIVEWPPSRGHDVFVAVDAVVIAEHRYTGMLLSQETDALVALLGKRQIPVVHICGGVDAELLATHNVQKHPAHSVPIGYMTVTTAHIGTKPVVDLHCAGLHAASLVSRARKRGVSVRESVLVAVESGFGLPLVMDPSHLIGLSPKQTL